MSKLKSEFSGKSGQTVDESYSFVKNYKQCKCNSSSLEPVWLNLNHHGLGKCFSYEQLNVLDAELKSFSTSGNAKESEENRLIEEYYTCYSQKDATFSSDSPLKCSHKHPKNDQDSWLQEFEAITDDELRKTPMKKEMENKKLYSDLDSDLIGLKNIEPWWNAADTNDLASLASQRPSQFVRNCDLPKAQTMLCVNNSEEVKGQTRNKETRRNLDSVSVDKSHGTLGVLECIIQGSDETISYGDGSSTVKLDPLATQEPISGDLTRSELLEALCHSQTRAREAEKLAREAYNEKERVIDLFFRQASYLFAYRQWLQMLQLESLCLNLRSKNQFNSLTSSALLPWVRVKGMALRKNRRRTAKKKIGKQRFHISKYAIVFALGLGLAGAGLLVGWSVGFLFPAL
ncbi:hypothetical protein ACJIZ3_003570 [Penstemon smallii]|uniref:Transmembrane protein n=1 Tax=Penstemon smallii TaxID=265156 RepID=A0ABD3U9L4_9LAMI